MRRAIVIGLGIIVLAAAGYFAYTYFSGTQANVTNQPVAQEQTDAAAQQTLDNVIWASGKVVPAHWAYLGFETGGRVDVVAVDEGADVVEGTILAELDARDLQAAVAQAEAALKQAEAQLAQVQTPARVEEIAGAEAGVQAAEAQLQAAQAALSTSQANVQAAQSQVAIAEASYRQVQAGPRSEVIAAARERMEQAQAVRDQAQAAYDQVAGRADVGMLPQSVALQQATAAFRAAEADYNAVQRGATREELAVAQSQVDAARTQVDVTSTAIDSAQAQVVIAEAAVAQATAQLDLVQAGARAADIAVAEAAVAQAQAVLDAARGNLAKAQLAAPFAGTVAAVWTRAGEIVTPGQQVLALGDLSGYQIETTDLRETDVARVSVGQPVEVTFDALPNKVFHGAVVRISPMSTQAQGSVNYTAVIELDDLDPALRWGMTAFVNIEAQ